MVLRCSKQNLLAVCSSPTITGKRQALQPPGREWERAYQLQIGILKGNKESNLKS